MAGVNRIKVDGIGFDYGNTLVSDPFERVMKLKSLDFVRVLEANGYEVYGRKFVKAWAKTNRNVNYPYCSHFSQEIPLIKALLESLGVKKNDRNKLSQPLLATYRSGLKYVMKNDKGITHARDVLAELRRRGKRMMILSNERMDTIDVQLRWTGLWRYFDRIIVSERLKAEKPDQRMFTYMMKAFGMPKERILYVGDDPERDIKPAKALGMKAVMLEQPQELGNTWRNYTTTLAGNEKPDAVIKDLAELLQIVR
jgi:HAD superfamily hydrolase (TIGR01549 family)